MQKNHLRWFAMQTVFTKQVGRWLWPLGVVLACLCAMHGCSPATNWRELNPPEAAGLKVLFPCKPEHASRLIKLEGLDDTPLKLHLLSCEADGATWALSYADMGSAPRRVQGLAALHDTLVKRVSQPGGPGAQVKQLQSGSVVKGSTEHPHQGQWWVQGLHPNEAGGVEPITVSAWQFSRGLTVFQATVWQNPLQVDDLRLRTFIEGFNFAD
jgi:hypothetical protein